MELVCERQNCLAALKRVRENKGSPGIDGMTVKELPAFLKLHWPRLREELLCGRYQPQPVRRVLIPKPGEGERELGIPSVLDRFMQQALLQVLQPRFDPTFSEASYGFRPGRRAEDAVRCARTYVQEGRRYVVDLDLEKFFRSTEPRRAEGKVGHADRGPPRAWARSPLSQRGHTRERGGSGEA
jgi:RNA-directed DNA polymerase